MRKITNVEELDVFKLAHTLALKIYNVSKDFPKEEVYGLVSQIRRAASSIPANLAEGANRNSKAEYKRFVSIAKGSAGEIYYQLLLAKDLGYLKQEDFKQLRDDYFRVLQMLEKLIQSLNTHHAHV